MSLPELRLVGVHVGGLAVGAADGPLASNLAVPRSWIAEIVPF
jgi:hypothetical protein